jgi:RNA polymerase sigma-70 factor (ECF subfamily)
MIIDALRGRSAFVTTNWNVIQDKELSDLIECYWGPVFHYLRRTGHTEAEAEDLTQEFFTDSLQVDRFSKADPGRGRFRAFLLSALDNFLRNRYRASQAQKRCPPGGLVSLEALAAPDMPPFQPSDRETPADAFNREWATQLVVRVLGALEVECRLKQKPEYFDAFRLCVIEPALNGAVAPPRCDLAVRYQTTEKEVSNRLITTRRAYQRLLRAEIKKYATSEADVATEMRDLVAAVGSR